MKKPQKLILAILLSTSFIAGCAHDVKNRRYINSSSSTGASSYNDLNLATKNAANALTKVIRLPKDTELDENVLALATSFVNIDNLAKSSTFGRTVSEQISSGIASNGLLIKEVRLRDAISIVPDQGELMLSRELKNIAKEHNAQFVLVGTYSEGAKTVYVSSKLIMLENDTVVAANNFSIEKNHDVATLLHGVRSQDLYPKEDEESEEDFGSGGGNRTLMDSIREYDKEINESRKKK